MKVVCSEYRCKWKGMDKQLLRGVNPFAQGEMIYGCPLCKSIDSSQPACDEPDCWEPATCGTSTLDGYRHTCGTHAPRTTREQP